MPIRGATEWNMAVGPDGAFRGAHMSVRGSTRWNRTHQSDGLCRGVRMSVRVVTKWNTAARSDGACRGMCISVIKATKWNTADQSDRACRRACMSVRETTKWNMADRLDGACRGMCMSVIEATKWNTADQSDRACRGASTSVRRATCREWRASSQCIIVESFLFKFCICYHLSCCKTNNWKTLSSFFTCCEQQQVDNTATKPKKVTAKLAKNFGGKMNHWKTCQGSWWHDLFWGMLGAVRYHLSLYALRTKSNSPWNHAKTIQ